LEAREPDRLPRRAKVHATSKLRDTHQLHLCRAPALIVPRMLRSAISVFTRVFDAPSARLRASSTRYGGVVRC
jgi:hypothetical protein